MYYIIKDRRVCQTIFLVRKMDLVPQLGRYHIGDDCDSYGVGVGDTLRSSSV